MPLSALIVCAATLSPPVGLTALQKPGPIPSAAVDRAEQALQRRAIAGHLLSKPPVGARGARILDKSIRGVPWTWTELGPARKLEPHPGARGRPVVYHQRLLKRTPSVRVSKKGIATVRFAALHNVGAASVTWGFELDCDLIATPRLRHRAVGKHKKIAFPLGRLFSTKYRPDGNAEQHLIWRLELPDRRHGSTRTHEGRLAVRCEGGPCTPTSRYVQLPTVLRGPFVDRPAPHGMIVSLDTDTPTVATVVLWDGHSLQTTDSPRPGLHHEIAIQGLNADQRYRYQVLVADHRGESSRARPATFQTAPLRDTTREVRIAMASDSRSGVGTADEHFGGVNRRVLTGLLTELLRRGAEVMILSGDLCDGWTSYPGDLKYQLDVFRYVVSPFAAFLPIYEGMGNHEAVVQITEPGWFMGRTDKGAGEALFADAFVNPQNGPTAAKNAPPYLENVYSFNYGPAHISVVNSNYWVRNHPDRADHPNHPGGYLEGWISEAQLNWLDADLAAAAAQNQVLIVTTHEPAFPNGGHSHDAMYYSGKRPEVIERRDAFIHILAKHGVSLLFTGDEHNYSRTLIDRSVTPVMGQHTLVQIVSGGLGAPWRAREPNLPWSANVQAFDLRQHALMLYIKGHHITGEAITARGLLIDRFELDAAPR